MKTLARYALSIISAAASLFAGCGGSQPSIGAPFGMPTGGLAAVDPGAPKRMGTRRTDARGRHVCRHDLLRRPFRSWNRLHANAGTVLSA